MNTENTFTEQSIDKTINEMTKNVSSKSIILAPFNSTISDFDDENDEMSLVQTCNKKVIKMGANVREIDSQYEKNNNGEMDNGVYNKNESTSFEEDEEANKLNFYDVNSPSTGNSKISSPLNGKNFKKMKESGIQYLSKTSYIHLEDFENNSISNDIVSMVVQCGFTQEFIINSLKGKKRNHATTTYYLLKGDSY